MKITDVFYFICGVALLCFALVGCSKNASQEKSELSTETELNYARIISLNGAITEIICALGGESKVVGVDASSTYPESIKLLSNVGYIKNITAESILSLQPDAVFVMRNELNETTAAQLESAGVDLIYFDQSFNIDVIYELTLAVATSLNIKEKGAMLVKDIRQQMQQLEIPVTNKKVLFIYARGPGNLLVAGKETSAHSMIALAGAQNVFNEFDGFKPLTTESLVKANPDILLLFDDGLSSLNGIDGILKINGVEQTTAGKNKSIITMNGHLLTGFGPRTPQALKELSKKIADS